MHSRLKIKNQNDEYISFDLRGERIKLIQEKHTPETIVQTDRM